MRDSTPLHDRLLDDWHRQYEWDRLNDERHDVPLRPLSKGLFGLIQHGANTAIMIIFVAAGFYVWEHESGHQLARFWGAWLLFGGIPSLFVLGFKGIVHLNQKQATRNAEA